MVSVPLVILVAVMLAEVPITITGSFHGTIPISAGTNHPGGLWTIQFGVGGNNGSPDILYFTDGINGERDGLFAAISPPAAAPENAQ